MAMWRLYGDEIAIQSTFDRLARSFRDCPCDVKIGCVKYFMPGKDTFNNVGPFTIFVPLLHKHQGFEYEQELRAIIWETGNMARKTDGSVLAPVDLNILIERVFISPPSKPEVKTDVEEFTKKHGITVGVQQSELTKVPLY
jgi:hypothetical protein